MQEGEFIYYGGYFFDLGIKTEHIDFNVELYDERDDLLFSIVRMPHLICSISSKLYFSAFRAGDTSNSSYCQ